jgi:hypothetical protein
LLLRRTMLAYILHLSWHQISLTPSSFSNDGRKMPWGSLFFFFSSYWNIDTEGTLLIHASFTFILFLWAGCLGSYIVGSAWYSSKNSNTHCSNPTSWIINL